MLKKKITFQDFNGQTQSEYHYFHLSKADLVEMEVSRDGGLSKALEEIVKSEDGKQIISQFKDLILASYGQKSDDGRRFIKTQELRDEFQQSEAYSALFMELCTNADAASEFVNGIVPDDLERVVSQVERKDGPTEVPPAEVPAEDRPLGVSAATPRQLTKAEVEEMDPTELQRLLSNGEAVIAYRA